MESMIEVYVKKLYGRMSGPTSIIDLMTFKLGYSKDHNKRGITTEFIKTINGSSDPMFIPKIVEREETSLLFRAPSSFSVDIEKFGHNVFLYGCPKTFPHIDARKEYYNPSPVALSRIEYLEKVGNKFLPALEDLQKRYEELNDAQSNCVDRINAEYENLFADFRRKLNNFGISTKSTSVVVTPTVPVAPVVNTTLTNQLLDVFLPSVLTSKFYLYLDEKNKKAYLQGRDNVRHMLPANVAVENSLVPGMRDPLKFQRAWKSNLVSPTKDRCRFQWHDSPWAKQFSVKNPNADEIISVMKAHGVKGKDWFIL